MRLIIFFVLSYALIERSCLAKIIIETSKQQQSGLVDVVVNILKFCYAKREVSTVGLAGISSGTISESLWDQEHIPVTLIDNATRGVSHVPVLPDARYKLRVFVVTATSSQAFAKTVGEVKESKYWNHMASMFILVESVHGCSSAYEVMWSAWELDLLNAKFVCLDKMRGRLIYTFNPYTSKAPQPWQLDETFNGLNNHTWTTYVRLYREDEGICSELDFDKTKNLNGYKIRSTVTNSSSALSNFTEKRDGTVKFGGISGAVAKLIFNALNATPVLLSRTTFGFVDSEGKPHGAMAEVANGISDLSLHIRHQLDSENFTSSRTIWESGFAILTQYRAATSQLSKLASLLDVYSRYGLFLVLLTTPVLLICLVRQSLSSSILNTVRLVSNTSLLKIPNKLAPRIYLACLFIFMLNIQGMYQGSLASLLSNRVPLHNVNSVQDLRDLGYTIYAPMRYKRFLKESLSKSDYRLSTNSAECINAMSSDPAIGCIWERVVLMNQAAELKLHLSTKPITKLYWVIGLRSSWPLEDRLNTVLARMVEADLIRIVYEKATRKLLRRIETNERLEHEEKLKVFTLKDLSFAFVILGIGLTCATGCFILEIAVSRTRSKVANIRKRAQRLLL